MSQSHTGTESRTPETEGWGAETFAPEPADLAAARALADERGIPPISLAASEGQLMQVLLRLHGSKKVVEVGTLFGYSAVWIARSLPADGHLWTLEMDSLHADTAEEVFRMTGVSEKVTLVRGPGNDGLGSIESDGPFDAIFLDADKAGYPGYLDWAESHVRAGGLIIGDNTYAFGRIHRDAESLDPSQRPGTTGLQAFNRRLADPERYVGTLLPTGQGMTVAIKK